MDNHRVLGHVAKEIDKLRADQISFLVAGSVKDFAEYRHLCGVIRGLTFAETFVNDLVQKMENSDD